jgi:hypothetical protein
MQCPGLRFVYRQSCLRVGFIRPALTRAKLRLCVGVWVCVCVCYVQKLRLCVLCVLCAEVLRPSI